MGSQIDEIENFISELELVLKSPEAKFPSKVLGERRQRETEVRPQMQSCERLYKMKAYYDRKTDRLRQRIAEQQGQAFTSPKVNSRSESLASRRNGSGKVQDRLHEDSLRRTQIRIEAATLDIETTRAAAKPAITQMAARIKRYGSISERLFQYNEVYKDRRQQMQEAFEESQAPQPTIKRALSPRPRAIKKKPMHIEEPTFKPSVNKHSEVLAKNLGHSFTRLLLPKKPLKVEQPCFKPTINKKSQQLTSNTPRWESLYQLKDQQSQRLDELRAEGNTSELDIECTFKPKTIKPAKPVPVADFVKRQLAWQKTVAEKVEAHQLTVADKDLEGCTFAPKINSLPASYRLSKAYSEKHLRPDRTMSSETDGGQLRMNQEVHAEMTEKDYETALESLHARLHG